MSVPALVEDRRGGDVGPARPVLDGAFGVLAALRRLGSARVSELQLASGLPRTTVRRLLIQLEHVGAVESSAGRWRLGPTVIELGAGVPASRHLRAVARRPLMDLATATGELVALVVESAGELLVIDVLPGSRPLAFEPEPGMALDDPRLAPARAYQQARRGDLRTVLDAGAFDRRINSAAAPLRLSPHDLAVVWLITPAGAGIPAFVAEATRRTARRIAAQLPSLTGKTAHVRTSNIPHRQQALTNPRSVAPDHPGRNHRR